MNKILLAATCMMTPAYAANASSHLSGRTNVEAAPQVSGGGGDACDARDYRYLIGKPMEEARYIGGLDYRIVMDPATPAANPKRLTVMVDSRSRLIRQLICG